MKTVGVRGAVDSAGYSAPAAAKTRSEMADLLLRIQDQAFHQPLSCEDAERILAAPASTGDQCRLHILLGLAHEMKEDWQTAAEQFRLAAECAPDERTEFASGVASLLLGNPESASQIFERGLRRSPESELLVTGTAAALYDKGRTSEALATLLHRAEANPTSSSSPYLLLSKILSAPNYSRPADLESRLQKLVERAPSTAAVHLAYACSLLPGPAAVPELERALALNPQLAEAHRLLGSIWSGQGQYNAAIREYRHALDENPAWTELHYRLAQAYLHIGQKKLAGEELAAHQQAKVKLAASSPCTK